MGSLSCIQLLHHTPVLFSRSNISTALKSGRIQRNKYSTNLSYPSVASFTSSSFLKISCSATLSLTSEVEQRRFDVDEANLLIKELQGVFNSGKTRSYEWRISQLQSIAKMLEEKEKDITEALHKDLAKPYLEAFISEISTTKGSCKHALQELKEWMKPEKVKTSITTYPSTAEIVSEPLGVVLVISTWNFPFLLSLDPVIGAICAGNAVVLKPSEIAPATSSLLVKLFDQYLDNSAIRVVEGAVPETTLEIVFQKHFKFFFLFLSNLLFYGNRAF